MKKILLISGKSGSGKDQVATYMEDYLKEDNQKVLVTHFADPVKFFLKQHYGYTGAKTPEERSLLQRIGTDVVKNKYPDYWGNIISQFISAVKDEWDYAIIPDFRFPDELMCIKDFNQTSILTLRVNRYAKEGKSYINPKMTIEQLNHISENALDNFHFDLYINNNGDLDTLKNNTISCVKKWIKE